VSTLYYYHSFDRNDALIGCKQVKFDDADDVLSELTTGEFAEVDRYIALHHNCGSSRELVLAKELAMINAHDQARANKIDAHFRGIVKSITGFPWLCIRISIITH